MAKQRISEISVIFGAIPAGLAYAKWHGLGVPIIPFLWLVTAGVWMLWRRAPEEVYQKTRIPTELRLWRNMFVRFSVLSALMAALLAYWSPGELFRFPREQTKLWALVMILYPFFSVLPQEFLYRKFFFDRYRPLFGSENMVALVSAFLFAFLHIVFLNPVAIALTLPGGLLFADTYRRTKSLALVTAEHALFGCMVVTLGAGSYLYDGSIKAVSQIVNLGNLHSEGLGESRRGAQQTVTTSSRVETSRH